MINIIITCDVLTIIMTYSSFQISLTINEDEMQEMIIKFILDKEKNIVYTCSIDINNNIIYEGYQNLPGLNNNRSVNFWYEWLNNYGIFVKYYYDSTELDGASTFYNILKYLFHFNEINLIKMKELIDQSYELIRLPSDVGESNIPETFFEPVSVLITKDEFNTLNNRIMGKNLKKELNTNKIICVICQEEICSRQHCTILICKHVYHKICAREWFTKQCQIPTCPCCRVDIRK